MIICAALCFAGCDSITNKSNITNLLSAPKRSQTDSSIVAAVENYLGENINLEYSSPQGYSAPIQFADVDRDGESEAAVFYYAPNKGTNIRFALLKNIQDKWTILLDKEGLGNEVFYFDTIQLPHIDGRQIVVGYNQSNIDENFFVTYFTDMEKNLPEYVESCSTVTAGDMTGDGYSDIVLTAYMPSGNCRVRVYTFTDKMTFENVGSKVLVYGDAQITQMKIANLADGTPALYADYRDSHNRMHTEVFMLDGDRLANALPGGVVSRYWPYERVLNSRDIDGDGCIETAGVIYPENSTDQPPQTVFMEWTDWTLPQPQRKRYGVYDTRYNLFIALPDDWQNNVSCHTTDNGCAIKDIQSGEVLLKITQGGANDSYEAGAYSYSAYLGATMWHLRFKESVEMSQIEYVYKNLTDFD